MKKKVFRSSGAIRQVISSVIRPVFGLMYVSLLIVGSGCSHTRNLAEEGLSGRVCTGNATGTELRDAELVSRFVAHMTDSFTNGTPFSIVERTHPGFRNSVSNDIVRLDENGWLSAIAKRGCLVRASPYEGVIGKCVREEFGKVGALWGVGLVVLPDVSQLSEGRFVAALCLNFNILVPHSGEPFLDGRLLGGSLCEEFMVRYLNRRMHGELVDYDVTYVNSTLSDNPFAWRVANEIQKRINDKDGANIPSGLQFVDDCVREAYLRLVSSSDSPVVVLPYLQSDVSCDRDGTCVYEFRVETGSPMVLIGTSIPSVVVGVRNNDWIVIKCQNSDCKTLTGE